MRDEFYEKIGEAVHIAVNSIVLTSMSDGRSRLIIGNDEFIGTREECNQRISRFLGKTAFETLPQTAQKDMQTREDVGVLMIKLSRAKAAAKKLQEHINPGDHGFISHSPEYLTVFMYCKESEWTLKPTEWEGYPVHWEWECPN